MLSTSGTAGIISPDTSGRSERRKFNLQDKIHEQWADKTPFFTLLGKLRKETTSDPLFKHFEHRDNEFVFGKYFVNAATPSTWSSGLMTDLVVDEGTGSDRWDRFTKGMIIRVMNPATTAITTRFTAIVTDATSAGIDLKLISGTATNPSNNDEIYIVGNAHEEFGDKGQIFHDEVEFRYGSVQDFRNDWGMSDILQNTDLVGQHEWDRMKAMKTWLHKIHIEKGLIFGKMIRASGDLITTSWGSQLTADIDGDSTSGNVYLTDGIYQLLDQYGDSNQNLLTYDYDANTYSDWINMMEKVFRFGNSKKLALCGRTAYGYFSKLDKNFFTGQGVRMNLTPGQKTYGANINVLETPYGDLALTRDEILRDKWADIMIIIDLANVNLKVMKNLDTSVSEFNIEHKTGMFGEIRTVCGLQLNMLETHALIKFVP